jgi:16S rRNA (cytosine967-C5)-methyltransferase
MTPAEKKISPARVAALQALLLLDSQPEALAADALAAAAQQHRLSGEDLRLARTLVYGVLRRALTLDQLYGRFLARGAAGLGAGSKLLLRVATFQRYYLSRIPDYAIVNDTLESGRHLLRLPAKEIGFLNAVLRKVAADETPTESLLPAGNRVSALSVRYSFPAAVAALFVEKFGGQKAPEIMAACNEEPPLTLRVNTLRTTADRLRESLAADGFEVAPGLLAPDAVIATASAAATTSLFETTAFHEGLFYAQDEGSQLVAHLALPWARGRILDLCAAPGGKTTHLAELTGGNFAITATDSSPRRLELIRENIARLRTPAIDLMPIEQALAAAPYDLVLVDAPCSGLGTVRRNPEVRYRVTNDSLLRHQERQLDVLATAAGVTAPGGAILYSTCSVSPQENIRVIQRFLKDNLSWRLAPAAENPLAGSLATKVPGLYSTWPKYPQVDGFEAAILLRDA